MWVYRPHYVPVYTQRLPLILPAASTAAIGTGAATLAALTGAGTGGFTAPSQASNAWR